MKKIVLANQKGGVGKSAIAVQLAYYLRSIDKRVLLVDFDHQRNTTKAIKTGGLATISHVVSSKILSTAVTEINNSDFVLVPGDNDELLKMEKQGDKHSHFANNLLSFLKAVDNKFDVCIFDTNPNPDIRQLASLVVSDYVLSPIQLNQEAIDGIGDLLNHGTIGIRRIQATINPKLKLLGILPNLVEPTPFQRNNLATLSQHYSNLFISLGENGFALIKKTTAIPEAQALGVPLFEYKKVKTSAYEAWKQIEPVFEKLAELMELSHA